MRRQRSGCLVSKATRHLSSLLLSSMHDRPQVASGLVSRGGLRRCSTHREGNGPLLLIARRPPATAPSEHRVAPWGRAAGAGSSALEPRRYWTPDTSLRPLPCACADRSCRMLFLVSERRSFTVDRGGSQSGVQAHTSSMPKRDHTHATSAVFSMTSAANFAKPQPSFDTAPRSCELAGELLGGGGGGARGPSGGAVEYMRPKSEVWGSQRPASQSADLNDRRYHRVATCPNLELRDRRPASDQQGQLE